MTAAMSAAMSTERERRRILRLISRSIATAFDATTVIARGQGDGAIHRGVADELRVLVENPGEARREIGVKDVDEARRVAAQETRAGGRAALMDEKMGRTVWIRDGSTGEELQPGE